VGGELQDGFLGIVHPLEVYFKAFADGNIFENGVTQLASVVGKQYRVDLTPERRAIGAHQAGFQRKGGELIIDALAKARKALETSTLADARIHQDGPLAYTQQFLLQLLAQLMLLPSWAAS